MCVLYVLLELLIPTSNMRPKIIISSIIILLTAILAALLLWFNSRPHWEVSAINTDAGITIQVYKSNEELATHVAMLEGKVISSDVMRSSRLEFPKDIGNTTFFDETLKPGRWTIIIEGSTIDIMEDSIIIDEPTMLQ